MTTTTEQEESLALLAKYAEGKYKEINDACGEAMGIITKGALKFAEESEKHQNPEDLLSQI